jgi:hypothetical protein
VSKELELLAGLGEAVAEPGPQAQTPASEPVAAGGRDRQRDPVRVVQEPEIARLKQERREPGRAGAPDG